HGVVRDRLVVATDRDAHDLAELFGRCDVDAVVTDAAARDDLEVGQFRQQLARDPRVAHDPAGRTVEPFDQLVVGEIAVGSAGREFSLHDLASGALEVLDRGVVEESLRDHDWTAWRNQRDHLLSISMTLTPPAAG